MSPHELHMDRDAFLSAVSVQYWEGDYAEELLRVLFGIKPAGEWVLAS